MTSRNPTLVATTTTTTTTTSAPNYSSGSPCPQARRHSHRRAKNGQEPSMKLAPRHSYSWVLPLSSPLQLRLSLFLGSSSLSSSTTVMGTMVAAAPLSTAHEVGTWFVLRPWLPALSCPRSVRHLPPPPQFLPPSSEGVAHGGETREEERWEEGVVIMRRALRAQVR